MKWSAEDYARSSSEQERWAKETLGRIQFRGDECILDVGCGDGKITAGLAGLVPRGIVLGVDQSAEMVKYAGQNYPRSRFPNLGFEQGEASLLTFNARFDLIVSFSCLHWVHDHPKALKGFHRALRPGGRLLLQFGGEGNALPIRQITGEIIRRPKWAPHFQGFVEPWRFCSAREYRSWVKDAGFEAGRIELMPKDMAHRGVEGLKAWLRTTHGIPYFARLPESLREMFLDEELRAYVARYPLDAQGNTHVPMVRLEVEAVRPA
ncbi:MAG: methyltransferase domain-containing protein [Nitrospirae bacterium]|nr:methyltransferase domain-containing protein [Nitrospirota bacterium]